MHSRSRTEKRVAGAGWAEDGRSVAWASPREGAWAGVVGVLGPVQGAGTAHVCAWSLHHPHPATCCRHPALVPSRVPSGPRSLRHPHVDPALSAHVRLGPLVGDPAGLVPHFSGNVSRVRSPFPRLGRACGQPPSGSAHTHPPSRLYHPCPHHTIPAERGCLLACCPHPKPTICGGETELTSHKSATQ